MPKPPKLISYLLFYYRCYPNSLSNGVIPNLISSTLTKHSIQHSHLCYVYFIFVLVLNRLTLRMTGSDQIFDTISIKKMFDNIFCLFVEVVVSNV